MGLVELPESSVPTERLRLLNAHPVRPGARFVLYWMTAARRTRANFALERAVEWAAALDLPLVVLEGLSASHPANLPGPTARVAGRVTDGMRDNLEAFQHAGTGARYLAYLEPAPKAGRGLVEALAEQAALVVGDAYPTYFLPQLMSAMAARFTCPLELVDAATLVPMAAPPKVYARAVDLRRYYHKNLVEHLAHAPAHEPLTDTQLRPLDEQTASLLADTLAPWPLLFDSAREANPTEPEVAALVRALAVDQTMTRTPERGGNVEAHVRLARFLDDDLMQPAKPRRRAGRRSGLSPDLHFGHLGPHEALEALFERHPWHPDDTNPKVAGQREGWWGLAPEAESWLDQVVTWRELGHNQAFHRRDHATYAGLPDWAQTTLLEHAGDPRPFLYDRAAFEAAATHDELWNAAQRQLVEEGVVDTYLRMLWGKQILHWSASPEEAFETCLELNDRYALDGRDPNSYSGISWVFGKHDRAWGPERPVFGKVRYMTSDGARRKLDLVDYLERFG